MNPQNKDQMHPDDLRNLFIFCVLSVILYFAFDHFIQQPHRESIKRQQEATLQQSFQAPGLVNDAPQEQVLRPRTDILQDTGRVRIDNGKVKGSINLQGARIDDLALSDYFTALDKKQNVVILSPRGAEYARLVEFGWISDGKPVVLPDEKTMWRLSQGQSLTKETPVTLEWDNGHGLVFSKRFEIDENYLITVTQSVRNMGAAPVTLHPFSLVSQTGMPDHYTGNWLLHEGPIGFVGEELHEIGYSALRDSKTQEFDAAKGWTGITDKYWLIGLIPEQGPMARYSYHYSGEPPKGREKDKGLFQADTTGPAMTVETGQSASSQTRIFAGAKQVFLLEAYEEKLNIPQFNLAVNFGWFWFFSKPFFYALHFLAQHAGNVGIGIILLTLIVRSSVFPLTNASYRSFAKMKKVSPQVAELRKLYGGDKVRLQEELLKLYQSEGVNPVAGCFPIFLQIPIFFALYKVLFVTIEMRHAPFFGWIKDLSAADPSNLFTLFGLIPWDAPAYLHVGLWPCLMLVALWIQKKLNPPPQDPIQRDMANYFPIVIAYTMAKFPAGLVVYWTFSAFIGIIQQMIIMRSLGVPIHLLGQSETPPPAATTADINMSDAMAVLDQNPESPPEISPPKPKKKKKK